MGLHGQKAHCTHMGVHGQRQQTSGSASISRNELSPPLDPIPCLSTLCEPAMRILHVRHVRHVRQPRGLFNTFFRGSAPTVRAVFIPCPLCAG